MRKIRKILNFRIFPAEMSGGCEGAIRRIDTTAQRNARLEPPCAADPREEATADIMTFAAAVVAMRKIQRKAQKKTAFLTQRHNDSKAQVMDIVIHSMVIRDSY